MAETITPDAPAQATDTSVATSAFNPDAYLAAKKPTAKTFEPDSYLKAKASPSSTLVSRKVLAQQPSGLTPDFSMLDKSTLQTRVGFDVDTNAPEDLQRKSAAYQDYYNNMDVFGEQSPTLSALADTSLLAGIEPSPEFSKSNPHTATVLQHVADALKIGPTAEIASLGGLAGLAVPARLLALGFAGWSAKGTAESIQAAIDSKDPLERTGNITDAVINGIFTTLAGFGAAHKAKATISPQEAMDHLSKVETPMLEAGKELIQADPKFKKTLPYDPALIDSELAKRKKSPQTVPEVVNPELAQKADEIQSFAPKTAEALKQEIPAEKPADIVPEKTAETPVVEEGGQPVEHKVPPPEELKSTLDELGARYDGVQEGYKELPETHQITLPDTGDTINVPTNATPKEVAERINDKRGVTPETEAQPTKATEEPTSIKNSVVDEQRAAMGLPERVAPLKRTFGKVLDEAQKAIEENPKAGENLVSDLQRQSRPLTDKEDALLTLEQVNRQHEYDKATEAVNKATNEGERVEAQLRLAKARDAAFEVYDVGTQAGTANARGLNARKMMVKQDYSLAQMENRLRAANNGKSLTEKQTADVKVLHDKIADLEKRVEQAESKAKDDEAARYFDELLRETKKERKIATQKGKSLTDFLDEQADAARKRLRKRVGQLNALFDPTQLADHAIIGASYIAKGVSKLSDFTTQMVKDFGEQIRPYIPDIFKKSKDYHDANSKFFEANKADETAADVLKRDTKGELDQKVVFDLMRARVMEGIEGAEKIYAQVTKDLQENHPGITEREVRDTFTDYGKVRYPSKEADLVTLREYRRAGQLISAIEDARKGEVPKKTGTQRDKPTQDIRERTKELNRVMEEMGIETSTPEQELASKNQARATQLRNSIEDLDKQLKAGEKPAKGKPIPDSAEVEALRSERDAMRAQLKEIEDAKNPPKSPKEIQLERYKKGVKNRIDKLQEKIKAGDYSKTPPRKTVLDTEAFKLQTEAKKLKQEFDRVVVKQDLKNRTPTEKVLDTFSKVFRAGVLSSPVVFAKLTAAAIARGIITPLEEGVGAVISKAIPSIAKRAPREGGASIKAEAKAITDGFTKGMKDAWNVLTKGESELSVNFEGKRNVMPRHWLDFIGNMHGALKAPIKRAEFARSLEKRTQQAIKNGVDVTDEMVLTNLAVEAYKDANRAIFMQDNRVVSAYQTGIRLLEAPNKETGRAPIGGKATATALRTLNPVVKIPTNIVAETMQYATGLVTGSARLANIIRRGVENLKPQEADLVMRELKKGTLGTAGLLLGYFGYQQFGGYYQYGKKQKDGAVKYGDSKLFGVTIPKHLQHAPLLEILQIGATVRKVADAKIKKSDRDEQGLGQGILAAGLGLIEETPLLDVTKISRYMNPYERINYFGELAKSIAIPQAVQWFAKFQDTDSRGETVKRDPEGIIENVKVGIPGLRKTVPKK